MGEDSVSESSSRDLLISVATALRTEGALGAFVIGSVARRTATDHSDIDILVVAPEHDGRHGFERSLHGEVLVEIVAKSEHEWLEHLHSDRPRWVYSFLDDGEVLFDDGSIDRLRSVATTVCRSFTTPAEVRQELASLLWHGRAKTERAATSDDPMQAAYWAALLVPTLIDALLALANRPTVPGSRRLEVLKSVQLDDSDAALLATTLTGAPLDRVHAAQRLAESLLARLGETDLERVEW